MVRNRNWGDLANSATGPSYNPAASDRIADGYTVVFSSLTNEGVQAYKNQVESLPKSRTSRRNKNIIKRSSRIYISNGLW